MELFTSWHSWQQAEPGLRARLPPATVAQVAEAVAFAASQHGDQRRPTGTPYLEHLLEALEVLVRGAGVTDPGVLAAAVLHDVAEDTPCTLDDLAARFGPRVAGLVGWVTIPPAAPGQDKAEVKQEYLRGLRAAPRDAILVKLADRASNVQTLRNLRPARQRAYYTQTVEYILPLADGEPWFRNWYASWRTAFADLAGSGPASPGGAAAPAAQPIRDTSSQTSNPAG
ncbi:MAG TPA: HD domain-containing protein [Streptosporangiaceae bacterium]|jgi:(p)ppGpp synthase/HD superfamily hydrolase|nr:HD domain-containing protein [Streptosporangiaceae bacterium]